MRKSWILWMMLVPLLLAACQGIGTTPTGATPEATGPAESAPTNPGEPYPVNTTPTTGAPSGSDLSSAYPPAPEDAALEKGTVFIDESGLMAVEGQPGAAVVVATGNLPTPCNALRAQVTPPDASNVVAVEVYSVVDPNTMCTQVLKPFSGEVARIGGLPSGSYTVTLNGTELGKLEVP